jgi:hypothetical protein
MKVSVEFHASVALSPGKDPLVHIGQEDRKSLPFPSRESNHGRPYFTNSFVDICLLWIPTYMTQLLQDGRQPI